MVGKVYTVVNVNLGKLFVEPLGIEVLYLCTGGCKW